MLAPLAITHAPRGERDHFHRVGQVTRVLARRARNKRLANALYRQAFAARSSSRERGPTTAPSAPAPPPITSPCGSIGPDAWAFCTAARAITPVLTNHRLAHASDEAVTRRLVAVRCRKPR